MYQRTLIMHVKLVRAFGKIFKTLSVSMIYYVLNNQTFSIHRRIFVIQISGNGNCSMEIVPHYGID